jgi:hypothetical protein
MFPGLPEENRRFSCISFKIIAQNPSIEYLPHCIDFTDYPSHQLKTKTASINWLFLSYR